MLADHAWVDEEGEMDYSFVPFSDDQQTLSVTASVVGSSVGLSDGHATQSDVEDPVIKALRQRQREEIERKREEELAEQRRLASIAKMQPVELAEAKPAVAEVAVDHRSKQQARLDEYKRIEEERKERKRLYEERNQLFTPVVEAPASMSWRETAKPVTCVALPRPEPSAVRIAQRPVTSTASPASHVASQPTDQTIATVTTVRERTLSVRLEVSKAPVKLKFAPSAVGELRAAIVLPEPRHKLDLTRYIGTSALKQ